MKVSIKQNGQMQIKAENELESFALQNWSGQYLLFSDDKSISEDNMIIKEGMLLIDVNPE